jgi:hypothetical protein
VGGVLAIPLCTFGPEGIRPGGLLHLWNCHITVPAAKTPKKRGRRWLTPVILATQEAEIRRNSVGSQPEEIVHKPLS